MANPRIKKIEAEIVKHKAEIEKFKQKITESQVKIRDSEREKVKLENDDIISLVRGLGADAMERLGEFFVNEDECRQLDCPTPEPPKPAEIKAESQKEVFPNAIKEN